MRDADGSVEDGVFRFAAVRQGMRTVEELEYPFQGPGHGNKRFRYRGVVSARCRHWQHRSEGLSRLHVLYLMVLPCRRHDLRCTCT